MVAISTVKSGDTLYSVSTRKMGHTTFSAKSCHPVYVKEVDFERGRIFASWNGNPPKWMRDVHKLARL